MEDAKSKRTFSPNGKSPLTTNWNKMMQELFHFDDHVTYSTPDSSSGVASDEHYYNTSGNSETSTNPSPHQTKERIRSVDLEEQWSAPNTTSRNGISPDRRTRLTPRSDLSNQFTTEVSLHKEARSNHGLFCQKQCRNHSNDELVRGNRRERLMVDPNSLNSNSINQDKHLHGYTPQGGPFGHSTAASVSNPHRLTPTFLGTARDHLKRLKSCSPALSALNSFSDVISADIFLRIFSHLHSDDLCRCARVCKRWYKIVWNPVLWRVITINDPETEIDHALKCLTRILSYDTPVICVIVEEIDLRFCEKLTDKGLYLIASRCPELRRLTLEGCSHVTNIALFEVVSRCVNIEYLNVAGCSQITCISLTPEANIQATTYGKQIDLRYLDMTDCSNLDDLGLQIIVSYCSQLVYIYLRRCTKVSDIGIQYLASYCTNLQELSINDCHRVTDFGLRELSRLEGRLRYLSVAKCEGITDAGVKAVIRSCTRLRYLNLRGCRGVTDESVVYLATRSTRLRSLDVGKCNITDRTLFSVAEHIPHLKKLSLRGCEWVTDRGVVEIARRCQLLLHINLQDCSLLTIETYRALRHFCRRCVIEHTNPGFH